MSYRRMRYVWRSRASCSESSGRDGVVATMNGHYGSPRGMQGGIGVGTLVVGTNAVIGRERGGGGTGADRSTRRIVRSAKGADRAAVDDRTDLPLMPEPPPQGKPLPPTPPS